jgi:hypothetical protein
MASISPAPSIPRLAPVGTQGRVTDEEAKAMLHAVLNLLAKWELEKEEKLTLLGGVSDRTFRRWCAGEIGPLTVDVIARLGDLLGIHKALRYMFTDLNAVYTWVKRPNEAFGGKPALEVMLQGAVVDIARVRAYLDAERAAW